MLNNFADEGLVSAPNLAKDTFQKIEESAIHPIGPEDPGSVTKGRDVRLDHAEGAVNGPENEENNEEMMQVPESLKIGTTWFFNRRCEDDHQRCEHDVARPAGPSCKIGSEKAFEALFILRGELSKIVPVSNGVDPGEEDNRESYQFVESDVLI